MLQSCHMSIKAFSTSWPEQNLLDFAKDILKCIFLCDFYDLITISMDCVPECLFDDEAAPVCIMTCWHQVRITFSLMMTSSNGNIFCVTGHLCGEFTGHRWITHTKASDAELWCFLWSVPWINDWVNNCEAGDMKSHHAHYDVIVMWWFLDHNPSPVEILFYPVKILIKWSLHNFCTWDNSFSINRSNLMTSNMDLSFKSKFWEEIQWNAPLDCLQ